MTAAPDLLEAQARAAFHLRLRERGVRDRDVLRALETVPRALFVPHRYADLSLRDLSIPIGCGGILPPAWLIGRMVESLLPLARTRVLEIGTGSAYATAILAHLSESIMSVERFRSLAITARGRLESLGLGSASVLLADGLHLPAELGTFDRILAACVIEDPAPLLARLREGGVLVAGGAGEKGHDPIVRFEQTAAGVTETVIGSFRLPAFSPGIATIL